MIINNKKGFIALFSVIIVSFILVLAAVTLSFTGFLSRFDIFDSTSKKSSEALADACLESARLIIAQNNSYTGSQSLTINSQECDYTVSSSPMAITAHGAVNNAHTYYWAQVDKTQYNIPIISFKECPNLSPCP